MSTNDILTGLGLVIVIALGCELVADRTRLPAIVLLLPAGFIAGALTSDVHPSTLFGAAFQPLVSLGVGRSGADKILPIAFIAIFGTVVVYGLSAAPAAPVARRLGLVGAGTVTVLIIGAHRWARVIASALTRAGVTVLLWTGRPDEQEAARAEGLEARNARLGSDVITREAELEEVADVLVLTENDNFNALAAFELRQELGSDHVYRLATGGEVLDLVPRYAEGRTLFGRGLTYAELSRRFADGATVVAEPALGRTHRDGSRLLFVVSRTGGLRVATGAHDLAPRAGETAIWMADEGF